MIIPAYLPKILRDLNVRIEQIIYLPLAIDQYIANEALERFIDEDFPKQPDDLLFEQWATLRQFADADEIDPADVIEAIYQSRRSSGWLVQAARPIMKYNADGSGASYSWGYFNTAWLYAPFFEVALMRAADWARERDRSERRAAQEKGAAA